MYILKALLNKPHSYLAQNISAATILSGECTEKTKRVRLVNAAAMAFAPNPCPGLGPPARRLKFFSF